MRSNRAFHDDPEWISQQAAEELPLFVTEIRTMARRDDAETSKAAAIAISETLNDLQAKVYGAFVSHGPMTAKQAEQLAEFGVLGFSTVRKRISELAARGWLRKTGHIKDGCTEYEAKPA